jgi:phosphatidate cytidylyltransferase
LLRDRLLSASFLISMTVLLLWMDVWFPIRGVSGIWLLPLLLFFSLGTAFDFASMLRVHGKSVERKWILIATALVTLSPCIPLLWPLIGKVYPADCPVGKLGWILVAAVSAVFLLLLREIIGYRPGRGGALDRTLAGAFASVYIGVPMALLVVIRQLGTSTGSEPSSDGGIWGIVALVTMVAATKSSDAGAYFTGKAVGRRKLIPQLSPGKTWEGAAGGIATAVAVSYACAYWLIPNMVSLNSGPPWWGPAVFGTTCAVAGMVGDLAESMVKRETGVKDSGTWLPGLGGVWDVTDSLIAAVMPAWLMLAGGLLGS